MAEVYGFHNGLNLDNLDVTTDDEINSFLTSARIGGHESVYGQRIIRGPLDPGPRYDMTANSVWLYTRPDMAKLHMRVLAGTRSLGINAGVLTASSSANMHTYINQGWEIGIENCMRGMQMRGFTRDQLMEVVMHAQLSAGIRGLEVVSRAIGILLGDYVERDIKPDWPEGWAPDMAAFSAGLDPTTIELTAQDLKNIEEWYEKTIGWQPPRVRFLAKWEPVTLKSWRGGGGGGVRRGGARRRVRDHSPP